MHFGKNLQHLRLLCRNMTQEALAEKLAVSRQTISKWESDAAQPDMQKALDLCGIFNCTLDNLFRDDLSAQDSAYSNLRVEEVPAFRFVSHTVISTDPENDTLGRIYGIARQCGAEAPDVIGWGFPFLTPEQTNVYHMHGYTAAWRFPEGVTPEGREILSQLAHRYAAIHIERPFDPFVTIPSAYRTLIDYMRLNGLEHCENGVIPCFETAGESMDVYIACQYACDPFGLTGGIAYSAPLHASPCCSVIQPFTMFFDSLNYCSGIPPPDLL